MTPVEQMHLWMAEIGPLLELADVTEFPDDNLWVLSFDEETAIVCQLDIDGQRMVLTAEVAMVEESRRLLAYERLLQYNFLWETTGGVRMGLDGPGGMVHLIFDMATEMVDLSRIETVVANVRDIIMAWREVLAHSGGSTPDSLSPFTANSGPSIRV